MRYFKYILLLSLLQFSVPGVVVPKLATEIHAQTLVNPYIKKVTASAPPAPVLPTTLLFAQYDAHDVSSVTNTAGKVSQWSDISGNSRHMTQATADRQPNYNGSTAISFDLTGLAMFDDWLDNFMGSASVSRPVTIYLILRCTAPPSGSIPVLTRGGGSAFINYNSDFTFTVTPGNGTATTAAVSDNTLLLLKFILNNTATEIQVNNVTPVTFTSTTTSLSSTNRIGAASGQTSGGVVFEGAIIYKTGTPNDTDVKTWADYRYSIPGL